MVAELARIIEPNQEPDETNKPSRPKLRSLPTGPIEIFTRPLEPIAESEPPTPYPEPAPYSLNEWDWKAWTRKRDAYLNFKDQQQKARAYALENDLRGTF